MNHEAKAGKSGTIGIGMGRALAVSLSVAVCVLAGAPAGARASLMAYDGFNYATGSANLAGLNGGFGWKGAWQTVNNGASSVSSGSLTGDGNAPAGYDALSTGNRAFTPNNTRSGRALDTTVSGSFGAKGYLDGNGNIGASGKTIYISYLQQPNGTTSYYEFEFHRGNLGDPGRVAGVGNDSGASTSTYLRVPSAAQTAIGAGSTAVNFFVVRIDFLGGNDTVYVYQNPVSLTEPGSPTLLMTGSGDLSFSGLSFGCFNNGRTVATDEIRVGETWADVVSPGSYSTGVWDGGGANNYWSAAGNWDANVVPVFASSLTFAGGTHLVNTNDLTGISANGITFDAAAGAFTLSGNSLGLNGNILFNGNPSAPVTQTLNLPLTPSGDFTIDTRTNGNITINGNVTAAGILTQTSAGNAGTLTLGSTNMFSGYIINGGTNRITGATTVTLNTGTRFALANANAAFNATLVIENGGSLTVGGNSVDAAVIGRDGGVATVIQNGGLFSVNIPNHQYLFVCATGNANSRGYYNLYGGILDMKETTLGVGLGAGGVMVTGVVNQAGGVVTNVHELILGYNVGQNGRGIYNLTGGSVYIGANGITSQSGKYDLFLGGGTVGAYTSWSSPLNMTLTGSNGPVTFNLGGNQVLLSGVLSGSGGLKVTNGVLELSGVNTYTGETTVNAGGVLQLDSTGSSVGALRLADGGYVYLNFGGSYVFGSLYTNGVSLPPGTYDGGSLPGFIAGSGTLQVMSGISTGLWTGGGTDDNWSTGGNWDNNAVPIFPHALTFAGNTRLANNNDLSGLTISSLTFDSAAGAFTIGGNDVTLSGGIGFNGSPAAPITQTVNLGLTFTSDKTITLPTNGNLALGGSINSASALIKAGAGTLALGGAGDSFSELRVTGGTNVITGNVTINGSGSSTFYIGDIGTTGTLVIQPGASLNVIGNFGDSGVLGRDSGSGFVIQNGGTFSFAPDNVGYLFVGASSSAATKAEYDMNDGILDLNSYTLAVALSANSGTVITGVVNQAGGIINNVGTLNLGAFTFGPGHGIYRLSGGTINIGFGGIISQSGSYEVYLGGGTVGATSPWSSPLNLTLTGSNGPVTFDTAGTTVTLSGALSGPGGLVVAGAGTLELSGATGYTGDTLVNNGVLQLDAPGSSVGAFRLQTGGFLNLNFSGAYVVAALYINGAAMPNGTYNASNLGDYIFGSGDLQVVGGVSTGLWDGGGADNNWSSAGNWDNNAVPIFPIALTFAGSTRLNNNNDLPGVTANGITFDSAAGAFVIGGNPITLAGNLGFNGNPAAPVTQTINLSLNLTANETVNTPVNGNLVLGGNLTTSGGFVKTGAGTLTLGGANSLTALSVNGGTNIITGNTTITGTGGSKFYVADGGNASGAILLQPGSALTVNGDLGDALVLGRDSGSSVVVQNGGTFTYNPNNQTLFLVGATSFPGTRSEYDMNGGVLDLSGKTLGLALADRGVSSTGIVNQAAGVVTNVQELRLSIFFASGYGIYNLTGGGLYLGSGGITADGGYELNLGGGTLGALASWASTLNMTLTGVNSPVTFNPGGNAITLSGVLSGAGGLTVSGGGTLELAGDNTYTGATLVNAGSILQLDSTNNSSSSIQLASGALLDLNYSGALTVAAFSTNGVAVPSGTYSAANLPAFITGTGALQIGGGLPTTPTNLAFSVSGGNLAISWPANYQGWILQAQTNSLGVGLSTNWVDVPGSAGVTSLNIPVNPANPSVFYRLRYPTP